MPPKTSSSEKRRASETGNDDSKEAGFNNIRARREETPTTTQATPADMAALRDRIAEFESRIRIKEMEIEGLRDQEAADERERARRLRADTEVTRNIGAALRGALVNPTIPVEKKLEFLQKLHQFQNTPLQQPDVTEATPPIASTSQAQQSASTTTTPNPSTGSANASSVIPQNQKEGPGQGK